MTVTDKTDRRLIRIVEDARFIDEAFDPKYNDSLRECRIVIGKAEGFPAFAIYDIEGRMREKGFNIPQRPKTEPYPIAMNFRFSVRKSVFGLATAPSSFGQRKLKYVDDAF
jgi:hypothetical protein